MKGKGRGSWQHCNVAKRELGKISANVGQSMTCFPVPFWDSSLYTCLFQSMITYDGMFKGQNKGCIVKYIVGN